LFSLAASSISASPSSWIHSGNSQILGRTVDTGRHFIGERRDAMTASSRLVLSVTLTALSGLGVALCFATDNPYHVSAVGALSMQECMNCHDKGSQKRVVICLGDNCLYSQSHSLMHRYPPRGNESRYAPVSDIEKAGCILENGKVSCLSCHDLTKPAPHLILEGDKLCQICHINLKSN
jgi:hypothetical protein